MIETVLTIEPVNHTALDGLNYNNRSIEVGLLIHVPDNPIYKCTKEITLAKLDDLFGHHAFRRKIFV